MEISFVNESEFKKQENRYFWSKTSEWELDSTISLNANDSLAGCRILVKSLSQLVIFLRTMIHVRQRHRQ